MNFDRERESERSLITKVTDTPDIRQIFVPLPDSPLKNLNCYVVCTPEENLIIDTGFRRPECETALWEESASWGSIWSARRCF